MSYLESISSVQSVVSDSLQPHGLQQHQASLSITKSRSLLKLTHVHLISYAIQPSHPLLPSVFPSVRVFSSESVLHIRWPKYWSFSVSPFNEYSGLISFRIDWFDILAI